jgi:hypothetical protein
MAWWGGAQTGYLHVAPQWRVDTPLTLVSTWDGDELSLVREHHQLRHARGLDMAPAMAAAEDSMEALGQRGLEASGRGLYWVIHAGQHSVALCRAARAQGLSLRTLPGGRVAFVPPLDRAVEASERLKKAAAGVGG